jgi:twinkle protein
VAALLTAAQMRAARALVGMEQKALAAASGVSLPTIQRMEASDGVVRGVIDSLMKCGIAEDDYTRQKNFLDQLCSIARDTDCHVHLIAHSRKGADEMKPPGKMDVKGSGAITDQVDNVLAVWRNKKKELDIEKGDFAGKSDPDCLLICDKQRNGEWEGRVALWLDRESMQYTEDGYAESVDLLNAERYGR